MTISLTLKIFIIMLLLYWGYIVTFTEVLTAHLSQIRPSIVLLYLLSPLLRTLSTGLIFSFSYLST
jgi:hypothetical protein